MNHFNEELGALQVVLERFNSQRLPRLLALQDKVNRGEKMDDFDLGFMEEVLTDATRNQPYVAHHPELQTLVARAISLYKEITEQALANEKRGGA